MEDFFAVLGVANPQLYDGAAVGQGIERPRFNIGAGTDEEVTAHLPAGRANLGQDQTTPAEPVG